MESDSDPFLDWLESKEGQNSHQALDEVLDALEGASVDLHQRRIIWGDGARLSVAETIDRIHGQSELPREAIQSHVVGWLDVIYDPPNLDEIQMEEFERLTGEWIAAEGG